MSPFSVEYNDKYKHHCISIPSLLKLEVTQAKMATQVTCNLFWLDICIDLANLFEHPKTEQLQKR